MDSRKIILLTANRIVIYWKYKKFSKLMKTLYHNQIFPVILEEEETGGYVVINPAFDGCYSQGETIEEALKNIKEATELCLEEIPEQQTKFKLKNISLHLINLNGKYA